MVSEQPIKPETLSNLVKTWARPRIRNGWANLKKLRTQNHNELH